MSIFESRCKVSKYPDLGLTRICKICGEVLPLTHDYFAIATKDAENIYSYYKKDCKKCNSFSLIEKNNRTRAINCGLPADLTRDEWNETKKYFDNSCAYCGVKSKKTLAMEHLNGNAYTQYNILPSCKSCNSSKHSANLFEWLFDGTKLRKLNRERLVKICNFLYEMEEKHGVVDVVKALINSSDKVIHSWLTIEHCSQCKTG